MITDTLLKNRNQDIISRLRLLYVLRHSGRHRITFYLIFCSLYLFTFSLEIPPRITLQVHPGVHFGVHAGPASPYLWQQTCVCSPAGPPRILQRRNCRCYTCAFGASGADLQGCMYTKMDAETVVQAIFGHYIVVCIRYRS